jgi:hypothetical protein
MTNTITGDPVTEPTKTVRRLDRELAEVTTTDATQTTSQDTTDYVNDFYRKLAQADKRKEDREFELRVFGKPLPPTTKDFLFGTEGESR